MIVLSGEDYKKINYDIYLALGSFDGLHQGHMSLIKKVKEHADANGGKSMVYTFLNHPLTTIAPDKAPKLLMDNDTKINLLSEKGIDFLTFEKFDKNFMQLSPEEFIRSICTKFNVKGIVVGFNYRFGYKNLGDVELLKALSLKYNFKLTVMPPFKDKDNIISSTFIRNLIARGNLKEANEYLLEPFMIKGKIISGKGIGRTLGYPTANLDYNKNFVIPQRGVYYTNIRYKEKIYKGITNIGFNPTVNGNNLTIETYILDFNKDIYGDEIAVYFIEKTRNESKFSNLNDLISQLSEDEKEAKLKKIYIK